MNDQFLHRSNFKRFIIGVCQQREGDWWEPYKYQAIGIIIKNHEAHLFCGGNCLRILGKLDLRESKNMAFLCLMVLSQCNSIENMLFNMRAWDGVMNRIRDHTTIYI